MRELCSPSSSESCTLSPKQLTVNVVLLGVHQVYHIYHGQWAQYKEQLQEVLHELEGQIHSWAVLAELLDLAPDGVGSA